MNESKLDIQAAVVEAKSALDFACRVRDQQPVSVDDAAVAYVIAKLNEMADRRYIDQAHLRRIVFFGIAKTIIGDGDVPLDAIIELLKRDFTTTSQAAA